MSKRKRLIKRQSFVEKARAFPYDLILAVNEEIRLIDWDSLVSIAIPAGGTCNALLLVCRLYKALKPEPEEDELFSTKSVKGSLLDGLVSTLTLVLVALCCLNAFVCYCGRRKYTLLGRAVDSIPDTPSAYKIRYSEPSSDTSTASGIDSGDSSSGSTEELWELRVWDPAVFTLYFGATFSPVHALYLLGAPITVFAPIFLAALSAFLVGIVSVYQTLLKDKSIVHSELLGEYDKKVVRPVVATRKRDVAIGSDGTVDTYMPSTNGQFVQRDVRESHSRATLTPSRDSPWSSPVATPIRATSSIRQRNLGPRFSTPNLRRVAEPPVWSPRRSTGSSQTQPQLSP